MYSVGISSCGFLLTEENFKKLEQSHIDAVEISMALNRHNEIDHQELLALSNRYHVKLWSYHLPFDPFEIIDISSLDANIREYTVSLYTTLIEKAAAIGFDKFIVHPSGEPIPSEERAERLKYSMQTLDRLAEIAHRNGAVIAVEDLPRTCLGNSTEEISRLISVNDKLRVCFDTNHLLNATHLEFLDSLADKIVTLHVSDYDFVDERHWLPGEGKLNWAELIAALRKINYRGVWMYEMGLKPPVSHPRSRELTFDDFVNNAEALFSGKTPERVL